MARLLLLWVVAMIVPISELEARAEAAIAALDASPYEQAPIEAAFVPSDRFVLFNEDAPQATKHLGYLVWVEDSPVVGDRQQDSVLVRSRLVVTMTYLIRPGQQIADARQARDAGNDVARAVCHLDDDDLTVLLVNAGRNPTLTEDHEVMGIRVEFDVLHEIDLYAPRGA